MRSLLFLLLCGALCLAASPAVLAQQWEAVTAMPTARAGAAIAVLDGKVYVMGGHTTAGTILDTVERFDPVTEQWTTVEPLRDARTYAAAAAFGGGIVLMGGREDDGAATDDVEFYDPAEDDWESFDSLEIEREGLGAAVLQGELYALGGAGETGGFLSTCEHYTDHWYVYPPWTVDPARALFGLAVVDGAAYLIGGYSPFGPLDAVQRYRIGQGNQSLPPLKVARGGLTAAAAGGALYAIGGRDGAEAVLASVERYGLEEGAWTFAAPLQTAREDAAAAAVGPDLYVFGGTDPYGDALASVEVLRGAFTSSGEGPTRPSAFELSAPAPNPFVRRTALAFRLTEAGPVSLSVYDLRGRRVAVLVDEVLPAGAHRAEWDAPGGLAGGVYVAHLATAAGRDTVKLTLLR